MDDRNHDACGEGAGTSRVGLDLLRASPEWASAKVVDLTGCVLAGCEASAHRCGTTGEEADRG